MQGGLARREEGAVVDDEVIAGPGFSGPDGFQSAEGDFVQPTAFEHTAASQPAALRSQSRPTPRRSQEPRSRVPRGGRAPSRVGSLDAGRNLAFPHLHVALYDYEPPRTPDTAERLPLRAGDTVQVLGPRRPDGLVPAELYGARGLVPHRYLEPVDTAVPRSRLLSQLGHAWQQPASSGERASEPVYSGHAGATMHREARCDSLFGLSHMQCWPRAP